MLSERAHPRAVQGQHAARALRSYSALFSTSRRASNRKAMQWVGTDRRLRPLALVRAERTRPLTVMLVSGREAWCIGTRRPCTSSISRCHRVSLSNQVDCAALARSHRRSCLKRDRERKTPEYRRECIESANSAGIFNRPRSLPSHQLGWQIGQWEGDLATSRVTLGTAAASGAVRHRDELPSYSRSVKRDGAGTSCRNANSQRPDLRRRRNRDHVRDSPERPTASVVEQHVRWSMVRYEMDSPRAVETAHLIVTHHSFSTYPSLAQSDRLIQLSRMFARVAGLSCSWVNRHR